MACSCSGACGCKNVVIPIGPPGVGIQGDVGPDGQAATINIGTVTTVPFGDPATVTNIGTMQAAIFDFEIPAGQNGTNGTNGADGADGADGANARTATTAVYTQPAVGATVPVSVLDTAWMAVDEPIFIDTGGQYRLVSKTPTVATLRNLGGPVNAAPTTIISFPVLVTPGGEPGTNGTNGTDGADGADGADGTDGNHIFPSDTMIPSLVSFPVPLLDGDLYPQVDAGVWTQWQWNGATWVVIWTGPTGGGSSPSQLFRATKTLDQPIPIGSTATTLCNFEDTTTGINFDTSGVWSGYSFTAAANIANFSITVENFTLERPPSPLTAINFTVRWVKNGATVLATNTLIFSTGDASLTIAVLTTGVVSLLAADVVTLEIIPSTNPLQQFYALAISGGGSPCIAYDQIT